MSHFKQQILIAVLATTATPAVAGSERLIYDPDSPYFMSDIDQRAAAPNENFSLRGSVGVASIQGREHVYAFTEGEQNTSLLLWDSIAPIASVDAKARLLDGWTLRGHIDAALSGDSNMTDYDWTGTYFAGYGFDNWTHRSISPNTSLDWYLNGDVSFGRDLPINEALTMNVNGGLRYTDVEWTATGGTYIYSQTGYRADEGTLADIPGVRYRMQLPTAFVGLDATVNDGPWSLETTTKAGLTFAASDTDHHYLRDLLFIDGLSLAQVYSANARLGYAFSDHLGAFVEAGYEKMISGHGDTDMYDTTTGALSGHFTKAAGGELQVASLKAGLKGNF